MMSLNPDVTEWSESGRSESNGATFDRAGFRAALVIGFRMVDVSESDCRTLRFDIHDV